MAKSPGKRKQITEPEKQPAKETKFDILTKNEEIIAGSMVNIRVRKRLFLPSSNFQVKDSAIIYLRGKELIPAFIIKEKIKNPLPICIK